MLTSFEAMWKDNIQYVVVRMSTSAMFRLVNGEKTAITIEQGIKLWIDTAKEFEKDHKNFRVNFVLCSMRFKGFKGVTKDWLDFVDIINKDKEKRIIGFDVIQEENIANDPRLNQSIPLEDLRDSLEAANTHAKNVFGDEWEKRFVPIFHSGEAADVPEGLFKDNMKFAFDHNTRRYGHGIALIIENNKKLIKKVAAARKMAEVCPISNMLLG